MGRRPLFNTFLILKFDIVLIDQRLSDHAGPSVLVMMPGPTGTMIVTGCEGYASADSDEALPESGSATTQNPAWRMSGVVDQGTIVSPAETRSWLNRNRGNPNPQGCLPSACRAR